MKRCSKINSICCEGSGSGSNWPVQCITVPVAVVQILVNVRKYNLKLRTRILLESNNRK